MARIAFVLPDLSGGGAERVAIHLAEGMCRLGHVVDFVVQRGGGELESLRPSGSRLIDLASPRLRSAIMPLRRYLRREKPDAVLAFMWPLTVVVVIARALARSPARLVLADHCALSRQYGPRAQKLIRATVRLFYPRADERVIVSSGAADDLASLSGIDRDTIKVLFNPVPRPTNGSPHVAEAAWNPTGKRILTVGRLKEQKNHLLLLEAFASLSGDAQLMILGEGPLEADLKARAKSLGIADKVKFPGFHLDSAPFYASADMFVLSSDYEGLPMVLVEALHAGLPIVSTDCMSGPDEILEGGRFGELVPTNDAPALAFAMERTLLQPRRDEEQKRRAMDFSPEKAVEDYLGVLLP